MKAVLYLFITLLGCTVLSDNPASASDIPFGIQNDQESESHSWTRNELSAITSLWIGHLKQVKDLSNKYLYDSNAIQLGKKLFFDTTLSSNGEVSCASCHQPERYFTDGLINAQGIGQTNMHTPSIVGSSHSKWQFWNGRKDSLWSQALGPLENPLEHGSNRNAIAHIVASTPEYTTLYTNTFGDLPNLSDHEKYPPNAAPITSDRALQQAWNSMSNEQKQIINSVFSNIGKALASYQNTIQPTPSQFDKYIEALLTDNKTASRVILNKYEKEGLRLFIGRGNCIDCHNGPLLSNHDFQNIGLPNTSSGRQSAIKIVMDDPFNCYGSFSDTIEENCIELNYMKKEGIDLVNAFKVPSLRNVSNTAPYMHDGRLSKIDDVIRHYSQPTLPEAGSSPLHPLNLTKLQIKYLEAFLNTLSGGYESQGAN